MTQEDINEGTLPLLSAGARLREARIAAGLDLEEVSARTRISKRHLAAIEEDRYSELASRTYAVGFSKTYARALGLNEASIADGVRDELARHEDMYPRHARPDHFEPGDPARVPRSSLAWMAGGGLILLFALLFVFWRSFLDPAGSIPDRADSAPKAVASKARAVPAARPAAATGVVKLTALVDGVWVKVSNAAGDQLFQKEMALNESYAVPADADGPVLATARPDALRVTVGDRVLGPLRPQQEILRDVSLTPESLQATAAASVSTGPTDGVTPRAAETSTDSER
ncbi:MAG: DUF4115 domain-containing protein [Novosphingobium sp.]|nr:DUF4115 domain-containing protein [Novosphingobium sp.]